MRTSNLANEAQRYSDVGLVWEEKLSGAAGTLVLLPTQTVRVKATAAVTVTIDGILAATMEAGEIMLFNTGSGIPDATTGVVKRDTRVTVVVTGTAFVQVARENVRKLGE